MTKINFTKSATATTIMTSLIIGLIMLSPMTVLPNVKAQQTNQEAQLPVAATELKNYMHQQLAQHPGWVGMMRWDSDSVSLDYLGSADKNPYRVEATPLTSLSPTVPVNVEKAATSDRTGGATSEWKEVQNFNSKQSNVAGVDLYHVFNALNSANTSWLQTGLVNDTANIYGTPNVWREITDRWNTSPCAENSGYPIASPTLAFSNGDSIQQYINAESGLAGHYNLGVTDITKNKGYVLGITITGDTGNVINLNRTTCTSGGSTFFYDSGPEVEEHDINSLSHTYNFGSIAFTQGYYDTPTSAIDTSVIGWQPTHGCGASVATVDSPAKVTFTFSSAC